MTRNASPRRDLGLDPGRPQNRAAVVDVDGATFLVADALAIEGRGCPFDVAIGPVGLAAAVVRRREVEEGLVHR